ncbi:hypothetical protein [Sphingomonas sp.]|uniref:hypothetical protein n=1 Tax=Sphingomonas sp. TaxID=28214 RepID=UPI0035C86F1D
MKTLASALVAATLVAGPAMAQDTLFIPTGNDPAPVRADAVDPKDSPEEIAKDAARDLKDSRFYNKPGATRADYDRDWQTCRLIARGSRTPSGTIPYYYNPAVISPMAAAAGGMLGGMIGAAIVEGQQRRANRRACLLVRGWRLVDVPAADEARMAAMTDAQRSAFFDTIVGASEVKGKVTERKTFHFDSAAAGIDLNRAVPGAATLYLGKKPAPDALAAPAPESGEGTLVLAFRRPDAGSAGRSGYVNLLRYDAAATDVLYQPRNWKKVGDKTTYTVGFASGDRKAAYEVQARRVTAGRYVINSTSVAGPVAITGFCLGAPVLEVKAGEVVYLGDFVPLLNAVGANGEKITGIAWTSNPEESRRTLSTKAPDLGARMQAAQWQNNATYGCAAQMMDRFDLPGMPEFVAPPPVQPPVQPAVQPAVASVSGAAAAPARP